jgi:hypothetical protein
VWAQPDGSFVMYYSTPATIPLGCLAQEGNHLELLTDELMSN